MEYDLKRNNINKKKSILLIMTIILGIGISLAAVYYMYYIKDQRENQIKSGLVTLDYNEVSVSINSNVPVLDEVGLSGTPYEFNVTNTSSIPINLKVKLKLNAGNTNIDLGAVRYGLYIDNELIKKDYVHDDLILYTHENFSVNKSINCKIYFWVDYYYDKPGKTFQAKITAEGESFDIIMPTMQKMCPDCVFISPENATTEMYTTWNMAGEGENETAIPLTPTVLNDSSIYTDDYTEITANYDYFLGVKLNGSNQITNAYACGVVNGNPICIEGTSDGSKYNANKAFMQPVFGEENCEEYDDGGITVYECTLGSLRANAYSDGFVFTHSGGFHCFVDSIGELSRYFTDGGDPK